MELKKIRLYQLHKQNLIQKADACYYLKMLEDHIGLDSGFEISKNLIGCISFQPYQKDFLVSGWQIDLFRRTDSKSIRYSENRES